MSPLADPDLRSALCREAPGFEVGALLDLLEHLGLPPERIQLRGRWTNHSAPSPVLGLSLHPDAELGPQAVLDLAMGLLTPDSPLPSYLLQLAERVAIDEDAFEAFFHFFDQRILGLHYEVLRGRGPVAAPEGSGELLRGLVGLEALSSVHWLFSAAFPELCVTAQRGTMARRVAMHEVVLDEAELNRSFALGGFVDVPGPAFHVQLATEDSATPAGVPWTEEALQRLEASVLPVLAETDLGLLVEVCGPLEHTDLVLGEARLGLEAVQGAPDRVVRVPVYRGHPAASLKQSG